MADEIDESGPFESETDDYEESDEFEEYENETDTDIGEESDDNLRNNVNEAVKSLASLIAHNEAYQVLIVKVTKNIELLLQNNREQQRKLKEIISSGLVPAACTSRVQRSEFNPPYFHDVFGMVPVANIESTAIINESPLDALMKEPATWSNEELITLREAVLHQMIEKKTAEVEAKKEILLHKIINYHAEDGIEQLRQWKIEYEAVNKRLDYLKGLSAEELLENAAFEELDWARISVKEFHGSRTIMQLKMKWMNDQDPKWNKEPWSNSEIENLKCITQSPWVNWDYVSEKLKSKRSPFKCFEKFVEVQRQTREKRPWTTAEDEKLLSLIQTFKFGDNINWNRVAAHMPGRNNFQCKIRYTRSLDRSLKRGRWGEAEDLLLTCAVNKYGPQDWDRIANQVPGRSALQCRARWINCLDYKKLNSPWTVDEDEAVLIGVKAFGRNQFSKISKLLPGRNSYDIKNRVRTLLRWKIVALLECQGSRQSKVIVKRNDNGRIKKFGEIARLSNNLNKRGILLNKRMGYGTYVVNEEGECDVDYSALKVELCNKFGIHYVARRGRWCRISKNPNEYGGDELLEELKRLPYEKREILESYMKEKTERETRLGDIPYNEAEEEAVMARVSQLMADNLEVDEKDIEWFHKNALSRKLSSKKKSKVNKALKAVKKRRRTSKRNVVRSDFGMYISDLAPKRYTVADRMADEFCYNVNKLPKSERRAFILNQMADSIGREIDTQTKRALGKLPREIPFTRVVNYIQSELSLEKCVHKVPDKSNEISKNGLDMKKLLSSLLPPAAPTLNCLLYFKEEVRKGLMLDALRLFSMSVEHDSVYAKFDPFTDGILDIRLSDKITNSKEYLLIKERIFKLFFWPMILKRSLENKDTVRLRQKLREMNLNRRKELLNHMEKEGVTNTEGIYQGDFEHPVSELFTKDPNKSFLTLLNAGRDNPKFFNPYNVRTDVLELERKEATKRRAGTRAQPGTLGYVVQGGLVRVQPALSRSTYSPRWPKSNAAFLDLEALTEDDLNKMTLKDLMLLDENQKRKVASIMRLQKKRSHQTETSSGNTDDP